MESTIKICCDGDKTNPVPFSRSHLIIEDAIVIEEDQEKILTKKQNDNNLTSGFKREEKLSPSVPPSNEKAENVEDLFTLVGDSGSWQLKMFILAILAGFPAALQDFAFIFIGYAPNYVCQSQFSTNSSNFSTIHLTKDLHPSQLHQFYNYKEPVLSASSLQINGTESCSDFRFDNTFVDSTIVTEWQLVCGDEFWASAAHLVYALGSLCGSIIFGIISDNYGRKKSLWISTIIVCVCGPAVAYSPNFSMMLLARFCLAIGTPAIYDVTHILILEMIGAKWRGTAGNIFSIPYSLGFASVAGFAYFVRDWRQLQLVLTIPALFFLINLYILPESPRWLISKGRNGQAEKILRSIARSNGRTEQIPNNFSLMVDLVGAKDRVESEEKLSCQSHYFRFLTMAWDLVRTPEMRRRTLALNFCWFTVCLIYHVISLNAKNLSANLFLYTCLSGLMECPSFLLVAPLIAWIGRRPTFSGLFFITGICLVTSLQFELGSPQLLVFSLLGMFHISSAYSLIFLYGIELIPTPIRTYGIGMACVTGRIGSALASYIANLGILHPKYPTMVLVGVAAAAFLCALILPETRDLPFPQSVQDVENSRKIVTRPRPSKESKVFQS